MAAGSTYTPIATQTLGSAASTVTFTGITSTYTDLILVGNFSNTTGQQLQVQVGNGSIDTGTNYSFTRLQGYGGSAASSRSSNSNFGYGGYSEGGNTGMNTIQFQNYSNTTTYKTFITRDSEAATIVSATVSLWRSTSAIERIQLSVGGGGTIASGSTFTLYGILAA